MKVSTDHNNENILTETFEPEKFSVRDANSEDDLKDMKKKAEIQFTTIKEFEGYLRTLLSVIHGSEDLDYSVQIQQGLEKLDYLIKDNLETKRMILREFKKKEDINKTIDSLNAEIQKKYEELKTTECGQLIIEKRQLLGSLDKISEEVKFLTNIKVDKLSEMNNNMIQIVKAQETPTEYLKVKEEMRYLKEENAKLRKMLAPKITTRKFGFGVDENNKVDNLFACLTCHEENNITLNFNNHN